MVNKTVVSGDVKTLVSLLADGDFHSGEEIGQQLGVSRTAVWKQLKKLDALGLVIESVKGKGYRLGHSIELLSASAITAQLEPQVKAQVSELALCFSVDSTNDHTLRQLNAGAAEKGYLCIAEHQQQGKGRRGRRWASPLGASLYLSLVWEFEEGATALEGLSLAVGIAVAKALHSQDVQPIKLKWPNDILLDGRKLGGILLEMAGDPAGRCQVVIGIGLNSFKSAHPDMDAIIDQPWACAEKSNPDLSRNQLAAAVISELCQLLSTYANTGFAAYRDQWNSWDAYQGRSVSVIAGDKVTQGVVQGVADNGALILDVAGQEQQFYGGELSLRPSPEGVS